MRKIVSVCIGLALTVMCKAQQNTESELDLLKAPSSPAAQLLNFAPSSIERPTDLSSFWLSINNASSNFTKLPSSYAVDFSPALLFGKTSMTLYDLKTDKKNEKEKMGKAVWQTLDISLGFKSEDDTLTGQSFSRAGFGVKFSLVRPSWSSKTLESYKSLSSLQSKLTDLVILAQGDYESDPLYVKKLADNEKIKKDKGKQSPEYKAALDELDTLQGQLINKYTTARIAAAAADTINLYDKIKRTARDFTIERVGFFVDFAGGFAVRFPTNELGYSFADNAGAWLTGGYEGGNEKLSFYGIARYLYQPEKIYADTTGKISNRKISTFDMGTRLLYATKDDKFNFSAEAIYRSVLNKSIIDPSWRVVFAAEYDLGLNKKLTFNFGRDFNGMITKGGNLIAALHFITGFGNKRDIGNAPSAK
jgi:hypothetical protein